MVKGSSITITGISAVNGLGGSDCGGADCAVAI